MRDSQMKKIPYTLILGDQEQDNKTISYRKHGSSETVTVSLEAFKNELQERIQKKQM